AAFVHAVELSGVRGRGGSSFPVARKLKALMSSGEEPLVVVNGSESEPASRKDAALIAFRPHLVLDGAVALADATGAGAVVVVLHRSDLETRVALDRALAERDMARSDNPSISVVLGPDRYVAGEASAIVALLEGEEAKPRFNRKPAAYSGVRGRPTLIHNVETVAHLALLARFGSDWFTGIGPPASPGSTLVTLAGSVAVPGRVLEVVAPVTVGELLATGAGVGTPPAAVLVGGYAGTWIEGIKAWDLAVDNEALAAVGATLGCGLIGVLPHGTCGLVETARLMAYLAGESAGQCGPCVFGLPALSASLADLATGHSNRGEVRRMHRQSAGIIGRGACGHPDGAVMLVESALEVFAPEIRRHLGWRGCSGVGCGPVFPLPRPESGWK
ncbi:MAG: NADH-ubiquinone oxidoreductase-F iron-sulfur binding region domain-containing protein, partial [Acidimicrobiales bacterium]